MDRICVLGAGSVGGHLAARLLDTGIELSVIARGETLAAIRRDGLRLTRGEATIVTRPRATDRPADLGVQDVLIVSVKFPHLAGALDSAAPLIGPDTLVVFAVNGLPFWFPEGTVLAGNAALREQLDPGGAVSARVPLDQAVGCVVTSGGVQVAPGHIRNTTPQMNKLVFGRHDGGIPAALHRLIAATTAAGYDAQAVSDIRSHMWDKMVFNAGLAPVSTIAERTARQTCNDPETRALAVAVIREIQAIGTALGFPVRIDAEAVTDPARAPDHRPSFLADLSAGRPLEIGNGVLAVRTIARTLAIPAPHLDSVAALMNARSEVEAARARG